MSRAATVSEIPTKPQKIQEGKYDPRMLKEGSREQPVASNNVARPHTEPAARSTAGTFDVFDFWITVIVAIIAMDLSYGVDRLSGKLKPPWL